MIPKFKILGLLGLLIPAACGGEGGTETGNTEINTIAAAMGAIFSGAGESTSISAPANLALLLVREARAQMEPQSACDSLDDMDETDVEVSGTISAGTYGAPGSEVEVQASHGCDQGGEFASFVVTGHSFLCTGDGGTESTVTMDSGTGVWRENLDADQTEIYGTFTITSDGSAASGVRCSLTISHEGGEGVGEIAGDCIDENDQVIDQSTESSCRDLE